MKTDVSIIVLNYNGRRILGKLLDLCLESLLNQDHNSYEIIFADNGSTDDSIEHVKARYGNNARPR